MPCGTDSQGGSVSAAVPLSELRQQGVEALRMCARQYVYAEIG